jgi:hypothetical protein
MSDTPTELDQKQTRFLRYLAARVLLALLRRLDPDNATVRELEAENRARLALPVPDAKPLPAPPLPPPPCGAIVVHGETRPRERFGFDGGI